MTNNLEMMTQILVTLVTTLVNVVLDQMMMTVPHVTIILIGMMDNVFQLAQMDIIKMILLILVRDVMDHA
jgi:hypothetical protein